jgi:hypothetical protein
MFYILLSGIQTTIIIYMAKIWVGFRGLGVTGMDVRAATTLSGLCGLTGVSYNTAKGKRDRGRFTIGKDGIGDSLEIWYFSEVDLVKVGGRGSKSGFRVGKKG